MKEGPVNDIPISIRTLNNNIISIWVDPAKTMNHFGNTPIYGDIAQYVIVRKQSVYCIFFFPSFLWKLVLRCNEM